LAATYLLSALSTEYIQIPVAAVVNGEAYDPTGDTVQFAFKPIGADPGNTDWTGGSWASLTPVNGFYYAQCLVGPQNGGTVLPVATYAIWIKVTDNPEVPVRSPGLLQVTTP
jgi:hypothetical protein